eukprot:jgi/Chlat1/6574/Chrsp45S09063
MHVALRKNCNLCFISNSWKRANSLQEAQHVLSRIIRAGQDVEKVIRHLSRKGKIDEVLMRVLDGRLQLAKEEDETEVAEGLELLRARLMNELQRRAARPGLRLLDELMHMDDEASASVEVKAARNRKIMDRMLKAFGMQSRGVDIFGMSSSIAQGKEVGGKAEQVTREEFVDAVDELLEEVSGFEAELAKSVAGNGRSFSDVDVEARRSIVNRVQEFKSIASSLDESMV